VKINMFLNNARTHCLLISTAFILSSCTWMPVAGPHSDDIRRGATVSSEIKENPSDVKAKEQGYALIEVTKPLVPLVAAHEDFLGGLQSKNWPPFMQSQEIRISVGDTLEVTLYEAQSGGLFVPAEAGVRPGNFIQLPAQTIDRGGKITIPYAGTIQAAGKTVSEMEKAIVSGLKERAIEPQAVVSLVKRGGSEVSVLGAVSSPQRYPLNFNGEKILDAISRAGGPNAPGYEMLVKLQRGGKESTIPFDRLVRDADRNIFLQPNDTVYLYREPKKYSLFGAAAVANEYNFSTTNLMLAEAIGKGSGLNDDKADPSEVFIYRHEDKAFLKNLPLTADATAFDAFGDTVPVVYKVNLRDADGYFLAQEMPMRDKDIVYISNSKSTEWQKFLGILNPTAVTTLNTRNATK
jgi:polysaccharide biosynthesis/export protein